MVFGPGSGLGPPQVLTLSRTAGNAAVARAVADGRIVARDAAPTTAPAGRGAPSVPVAGEPELSHAPPVAEAAKASPLPADDPQAELAERLRAPAPDAGPDPALAAIRPTLIEKNARGETFKMVGPCGTSGVVLEVTGTGHATHLGRHSGFYRECLDPATGAVTGGTFTLTAADGDTIFGTFSGQAVPTDDPDLVNYEDPGVITGGTGRFADARGRVTTSGLANLATGEYRGTIVGRMR